MSKPAQGQFFVLIERHDAVRRAVEEEEPALMGKAGASGVCHAAPDQHRLVVIASPFIEIFARVDDEGVNFGRKTT